MLLHRRFVLTSPASPAAMMSFSSHMIAGSPPASPPPKWVTVEHCTLECSTVRHLFGERYIHSPDRQVILGFCYIFVRPTYFCSAESEKFGYIYGCFYFCLLFLSLLWYEPCLWRKFVACLIVLCWFNRFQDDRNVHIWIMARRIPLLYFPWVHNLLYILFSLVFLCINYFYATID